MSGLDGGTKAASSRVQWSDCPLGVHLECQPEHRWPLQPSGLRVLQLLTWQLAFPRTRVSIRLVPRSSSEEALSDWLDS